MSNECKIKTFNKIQKKETNNMCIDIKIKKNYYFFTILLFKLLVL